MDKQSLSYPTLKSISFRAQKTFRRTKSKTSLFNTHSVTWNPICGVCNESPEYFKAFVIIKLKFHFKSNQYILYALGFLYRGLKYYSNYS